jgi:PAS domain S-box-containing protein
MFSLFLLIIDLSNIYVQITGALGIVGVLWAAAKKGKKIYTLVADGVGQLAEIREQLRPNGGNSMYDKLSEVVKTVLVERDARHFQWANEDTAVWECDGDGKCVWVSKKLAELFGMENAQLLGKGWLGAVEYDERERVWKRWTRSVQQGIPYEDHYIIVNQKSGLRVACKATATVCTIHDVPERYFGTVTPVRTLGQVGVGSEVDNESSREVE